MFLQLECGEGGRAHLDLDQRSRGRLSKVQHSRIAVRGFVPSTHGCDLPALGLETVLTPAQREALRADIAS